MTIASDLRRVRDLLSDPARWMQGALARDRDNDPVGYRDSTACKFCLEGGLRKSTNHVDTMFVVKAASFHLYQDDVLYRLNDTLGHAAVLRVLDLAIERAGA